jgi:hypothetical protein
MVRIYEGPGRDRDRESTFEINVPVLRAHDFSYIQIIADTYSVEKSRLFLDADREASSEIIFKEIGVQRNSLTRGPYCDQRFSIKSTFRLGRIRQAV